MYLKNKNQLDRKVKIIEIAIVAPPNIDRILGK